MDKEIQRNLALDAGIFLAEFLKFKNLNFFLQILILILSFNCAYTMK